MSFLATPRAFPSPPRRALRRLPSAPPTCCLRPQAAPLARPFSRCFGGDAVWAGAQGEPVPRATLWPALVGFQNGREARARVTFATRLRRAPWPGGSFPALAVRTGAPLIFPREGIFRRGSQYDWPRAAWLVGVEPSKAGSRCLCSRLGSLCAAWLGCALSLAAPGVPRPFRVGLLSFLTAWPRLLLCGVPDSGPACLWVRRAQPCCSVCRRSCSSGSERDPGEEPTRQLRAKSFTWVGV